MKKYNFKTLAEAQAYGSKATDLDRQKLKKAMVSYNDQFSHLNGLPHTGDSLPKRMAVIGQYHMRREALEASRL